MLSAFECSVPGRQQRQGHMIVSQLSKKQKGCSLSSWYLAILKELH